MIVEQEYFFDLPFYIESDTYFLENIEPISFPFEGVDIIVESIGVTNKASSGNYQRMPKKKYKGYKYGSDVYRVNNVKLKMIVETESIKPEDLKYNFSNAGYRHFQVIAQDSLHYFLEVTRQVTRQWWINRLTHDRESDSTYASIRFRFPDVSSNWIKPSYYYGGVGPRYLPSLFCSEDVETLNSNYWRKLAQHLNNVWVFDPVEALRLDVKSFVAQRSFNIAVFTLAQAFEIATKRILEKISNERGTDFKSLEKQVSGAFCAKYLIQIPKLLGLDTFQERLNLFYILDRLFKTRNKIAHEGEAYFIEPIGWLSPGGYVGEIKMGEKVYVNEIIGMWLIQNTDSVLRDFLKSGWAIPHIYLPE